MKIGIPNIDVNQYGMPALHMEALLQSAAKIGPIGIRPVSKFAHAFIMDGNPTKTFNIKNKSSNAGPSAGLIAVDPLFSRAPELTQKEISLPADKRAKVLALKQKISNADYLKKLKESHEKDLLKETDSRLKEVDLKITHARMEELVKLDKTMHVEELENSKYKYKISWGEDYNPKVAYAKIDGKNLLNIFDQNDQPLKVLGRTFQSERGSIIEKGITADYDLLVVCPTFKDFEPGGKDKTPFKTQGLTEFRAEKNKAAVINSPERPEMGGVIPAESVKGGNWSERVEQAVATINADIAKLDPLRKTAADATIHHNSEFNNPFADTLTSSIPCLFALPRAMDLTSVLAANQPNPSPAELEQAQTATLVLIETLAEMNLLRNVIRNEGFYWPAHAGFVDTIQPFRPEVMTLMEADTLVAAEQATRPVANSTATIFLGLHAPVAPTINIVKQHENIQVDGVALEEFSTTVREELTQTADSHVVHSPVRPG
jgi:hypothetical protein